MAKKSVSSNIKAMSFEAALGELEEIVEELEQGQGELEKAITAYERGVALKTHCEAKLTEAQLKVQKITVDLEGAARGENMKSN
ncbi:MAG: exodeoxyribonuclease VII small subunit [Proteobacteria bacterium]|nr:exodeoxyribonuclease VII small subunit [Pseudomonadota bacterium]